MLVILNLEVRKTLFQTGNSTFHVTNMLVHVSQVDQRLCRAVCVVRLSTQRQICLQIVQCISPLSLILVEHSQVVQDSALCLPMMTPSRDFKTFLEIRLGF